MRNVRPLTEIYAELHSGLRQKWTMALVVVSISAFDMTSVADAISSGQSRDASRSKVVAD